MAYDTLRLSRRGGVATVTLARPDKRNPLDGPGARELLEAVAFVQSASWARVLVLTGEGPAFCAGGDLKAFVRARPLDHLDGVAPIVELAKRMFSLKVPTLARVNGLALGGGAGLVTLCDFAIAAEDAELGYPEINLGLIPATVAVLLARTVGRRAAFDLLFTGRRVKGQEAVAMGLINQAVPRAALDPAVSARAKELSGKSPMALRQLKALFYGQMDQPLERALEGALDKFVGLTSGEDAKEGLDAFFAKRRPRWKGR